MGDAGAAAAAGAGRDRDRICLPEPVYWPRLPSVLRNALIEGKDNHTLHAMQEVPAWVTLAPTLAMLVGVGLAYLYYVAVPALPAVTARAFYPLYLFLLNKWYFDELYDWLLVRPAMRLGRILWKQGDGAIIDGLGPDGVASRVLWTTGRVVRLQTGYVYHYAFAMLIGVALLVTWFMFYAGVGR